jgi:hypothetical protein
MRAMGDVLLTLAPAALPAAALLRGAPLLGHVVDLPRPAAFADATLFVLVLAGGTWAHLVAVFEPGSAANRTPVTNVHTHAACLRFSEGSLLPPPGRERDAAHTRPRELVPASAALLRHAVRACNPDWSREDPAALARIAAPLSPPASRALAAARARVLAEQRGSRDDLAELLRAQGYVAHEAVLAFEELYGGLAIPAEPPEDPRWSGDDTLHLPIGAYWCLGAGHHVRPRDGDPPDLVPIAYTPDDALHYLDAEGRAWVEDTIDLGGPFLAAGSARAWLARTLLLPQVFHRSTGHRCRGAGRRGEQIARALGLPELADASGGDERWWGDEATLVVEPIDFRYLAGEHEAPEISTAAWTEDPAVFARLLRAGLVAR